MASSLPIGAWPNMYPNMIFDWGSYPLLIPVETLLLSIAFILSYFMFYYLTRVGFFKTTIIFFFGVLSVLLGSKLLLYGGVLFGILCFGVLTKLVGSSRRIRMKMWDALALIACMDVVVLRMDAWAQNLIELGLCLLLFLFLSVLFYRKKSQSKLFEYFLLGYSSIQFFIEFFPGENSRSIDLWLGLSSSQMISLVVFSLVLLRSYLQRGREKVPVLKLNHLKANV